MLQRSVVSCMHRPTPDRTLVLLSVCWADIKVTLKWTTGKLQSMRYLQGTKDFTLTFRRFDNLEVIGFSWPESITKGFIVERG